MDESEISEIRSLQNSLAEAKYGVKYYGEKFADLSTQVEQLCAFASAPSLEKLALYLSRNLVNSKGQLLQDLIVAFLHQEQSGFYCEFGAADGKTLSNTFFLEKMGWDGILAEPSIRWHNLLNGNRSCRISYDCVYPTSGEEVMFNEVEDGMFSSLIDFSVNDMHAHRRVNGYVYPVRSISLEDLLRQHSAPKHVDFLSIDTEGSELAILEAFNFKSYTFGVICVEHNFTESRKIIYNLLNENGYRRFFSRFSRWDDWYVNNEHYDFLKSNIGDEELL